MKRAVLSGIFFLVILLGFGVMPTKAAMIQRLYNPNSGEHFYSKDMNEVAVLMQAGWHYEGVGWIAPDKGIAVYRTYNPNAGDHHYTTDLAEVKDLVKKGWKDEGISFYAASKGVAVHREYNPNAKAGTHNFTVNKYEDSELIAKGWKKEGIGFYVEAFAPKKPTMELLSCDNYSTKDFSTISSTFAQSDYFKEIVVKKGLMVIFSGDYSALGMDDTIYPVTSNPEVINKATDKEMKGYEAANKDMDDAMSELDKEIGATDPTSFDTYPMATRKSGTSTVTLVAKNGAIMKLVVTVID